MIFYLIILDFDGWSEEKYMACKIITNIYIPFNLIHFLCFVKWKSVKICKSFVLYP